MTAASAPRPLTLRGTPIPESLNEEMIRRVVHGFYTHVRADPLLEPVFARRIADDHWPAHLDKMCDFWSATLLRTDRYGGRPLLPHLAIEELADAHFDRWLTLFRQTVRAECDSASAEVFFEFARRIGRSFRMALAFQRGEDSTALAPLPIDMVGAAGEGEPCSQSRAPETRAGPAGAASSMRSYRREA